MPSYDVSADEFHEFVAQREAEGEQVVGIATAGDGAYKVVTSVDDKRRRASGQKETRS